jgi:hypothetical protein
MSEVSCDGVATDGDNGIARPNAESCGGQANDCAFHAKKGEGHPETVEYCNPDIAVKGISAGAAIES